MMVTLHTDINPTAASTGINGLSVLPTLLHGSFDPDPEGQATALQKGIVTAINAPDKRNTADYLESADVLEHMDMRCW